MPNDRTAPTRNKDLLIYLLIFLVALVIRIYRIDATSFWQDEAHEVGDALNPFSEIWGITPHGRSPLEYYIVALFLRIGETEFWARMPAVLFGSGFVALMAWWARRIGGWGLAACATLLALTLPVHVRFSQEASSYSLMFFSQMLFYAHAWNMFHRPGRPSAGQWALLVFAAELMLWSHEPNWIALALAVPQIALWFVLTRRRGAAWPDFLKRYGPPVLVSTLAGFIVFLPLLIRQIVKPRTYSHPWNIESIAEFKYLAIQYIDIFTQGYDHFEYTDKAGIVGALLMATGMLGLFGTRRFRLLAIFCAIQFFGLFFGMFAAMRATDHWMEMRYALVAMPAGLMLAAMGIYFVAGGAVRMVRRGRRAHRRLMTRSAAAAALAACLLNGVWIVNHVNPRPDYRGVMQMIRDTGDDSTVWVMAEYDWKATAYYARRFEMPNEVRKLENEQELLLTAEGWFINNFVFDPRDHTQYLRSWVPVEAFAFLQVHSTKLVNASRLAALPGLSAARPVLRIELGDEDEPHIGGGWYPPEEVPEAGMRAFGPDGGELVFRVDGPVEGLRLRMAARPYVIGGATAATGLTIHLDGRVIHETQTGVEPFVIEETLPEMQGAPGYHRLWIKPDGCEKPNHFDPAQPGDWRCLSYWIESVELSVTGESGD